LSKQSTELASHRPIAVPTIEYLQVQWLESLGVEVTCKQIEWGRLLDRLFREIPRLWFMGWAADHADSDNSLRASSRA